MGTFEHTRIGLSGPLASAPCIVQGVERSRLQTHARSTAVLGVVGSLATLCVFDSGSLATLFQAFRAKVSADCGAALRVGSFLVAEEPALQASNRIYIMHCARKFSRPACRNRVA